VVYHQAVAPGGNPHAFTPVAFYSEDTHYSIVKAMRVLGIHTFYEIGVNEYPNQCPITPDKQWPGEVPSLGGGGGPGTIDLDALEQLVEFFASKGYPILINFNYGSTFKGAYDDVETASKRLLPILEKYGLAERMIADQGGHGFARSGYWFHVDGALGASYMPFLEMAHNDGKLPRRGPLFDFRLPSVHSMTMSGHKWIGAPWPCGVYMSKTKYLLMPPSRPAYIGSLDSTLAGSRNGFSAMVLWDYVARNSYASQTERALRLEELSEYAYQQLKALEHDVGDLWVDRSPLALTIRFRRPVPRIVFKYSLANETLFVDGKRRDYSHIYVMGHATRKLIDELVDDLRSQDAFVAAAAGPPAPPLPAGPPSPQVAMEQFRPLLHVPSFGRGLH
jgi:histidine decarboxylase